MVSWAPSSLVLGSEQWTYQYGCPAPGQDEPDLACYFRKKLRQKNEPEHYLVKENVWAIRDSIYFRIIVCKQDLLDT